MGRVRMLPTAAGGVRLADAVKVYLATITVQNTRETYAAALDRLVNDFGADTNVALLGQEPDRVSGWFTFVWGGKAAKTFNIRLTALASACVYWREQGWLSGDPLVRLRARPAPPDTSKALSKDRVAEILGSDAALRERQPLIGQVRQLRPVLAAEQVQQPEHDVGVYEPVSVMIASGTFPPC